MGRANAFLFSPAPPRGPLPPASPDLPASLLCPQDPHILEGALEEFTSLGAQQAPWPEWARRSPATSLPLFPEGPSLLPLLISPASGTDPVWPPLLLLSQCPHILPVHLGVGSSHLFGHQRPPPAAGRCPSCGEMLTASSHTAILTLPPQS